MKIIITFICLIGVFSGCRHSQSSTALSSSEFHWRAYSAQALKEALVRQKPIVIDFFAEWCPNCVQLDREVFALPQIQAKLSQVIALRVDVTNQDDPQIQQISQEYGIEGVPTVVFLDSKGHEIKDSRIMGFVTAQEFIQALALLNIFK